MQTPSADHAELEGRCRALVEALGLACGDQVVAVTPLTGGVASDIARVDLPDGPVCVKFALPKLKVAADWRAPVHRNRAEYAWLEVAARVAPDSAVRLYGRSDAAHGFAMEFLVGDDIYLWKAALLSGQTPRGEAASVGGLLGSIHAASTAPGFDRSAFDNRDDFHALRIEPYLLHTAQAHPALSTRLRALADALNKAETVLVHGDVSPKNILLRPQGPVLLDAECATMGDAAFDIAFCLNHLCLKAVHLPLATEALVAEVVAFWEAYAPHVAWEDPAALEARVCRLLPALMLARVDGKSPVEYLDDSNRACVRALAISLIEDEADTLGRLMAVLSSKLKGART